MFSQAAGQVPNEYIYGTLLSNAARSRNYECLTHILKVMWPWQMYVCSTKCSLALQEMKRDEVLPNQFIQDILAGVITHKPKVSLSIHPACGWATLCSLLQPQGENQLKRFNGFNGYYQLWKRTMSPV